MEVIVNVGYDQVAFLKGKRIAVTGRVSDMGGKPTMYIGNGKDVEVIKDSQHGDTPWVACFNWPKG
jgi:DNA/RNA endonuclease YhcR with UshA esterase domain